MKNNMEYGELLVTGTGHLEIRLKHNPRHVVVRFVGDCDPTPCNIPGLEDSVEATIIEKGNFWRKKPYILISWRVSSERAIVWETFGN